MNAQAILSASRIRWEVERHIAALTKKAHTLGAKILNKTIVRDMRDIGLWNSVSPPGK